MVPEAIEPLPGLTSSPLGGLPLALRGLRRVAAAAALGALRRRRIGAGAGRGRDERRHGALGALDLTWDATETIGKARKCRDTIWFFLIPQTVWPH